MTTEDRRRKAREFLASLPARNASEGIGAVIDRAREAAWAELWGCPFCGASSGERCVDEVTSGGMDFPHGRRVEFASSRTGERQ